MGPPDSHGVPRAPRYSGYCLASPSFAYRTVTVYGFTFQRILLGRALAADAVLQPRRNRNPCGLGSSPVARHYWGNHVCFLFLRVLRCFSSPGWPPYKGLQAFSLQGCPIQVSADHRSLAPTRGLSQLATPFVASWSLGIHRTPLRTFACVPDGSRLGGRAYTLAFRSLLLLSAMAG